MTTVPLSGRLPRRLRDGEEATVVERTVAGMYGETRIREAAARVLGRGSPVLIRPAVARFEVVSRVIDEFLAEYSHAGMLLVDESTEGSVVTRSAEWKGISLPDALAK